MFPTLSDRASALVARLGALAWMYALVPIPLVTDFLETGSLPRSPREWITEIVAGSVIAALVSKVRRSQRMLEAQARTDGLTGLKNRHVFKTAIDIECARSRRSGAALSLVYMDLDRFKQINDRLGHAAGDQILRQFAQAIRETIRSHVDAGFRLGGDEFALVLPSSTKDQAREVVDRLRSICAMRDPLWAVGAVDFSAGIVELDPDETASSLLARSDKAMYLQKQEGA
jgi:diguanylate cyclase (GGDEF)-like protein